MPSCRHDEQPPLAKQITVHIQVGGGRVAHPSGPGAGGGPVHPRACYLPQMCFSPKVNRKTDSQVLDISRAGAHWSQPGTPSLPPAASEGSFQPSSGGSPSLLCVETLRVTELQILQAQSTESLKLRCTESSIPLGRIVQWLKASSLDLAQLSWVQILVLPLISCVI